MPVEGSKDMYLVDDITFMRVPVEKEGGFNRTMTNYQVLVCFLFFQLDIRLFKYSF